MEKGGHRGNDSDPRFVKKHQKKDWFKVREPHSSSVLTLKQGWENIKKHLKKPTEI